MKTVMIRVALLGVIVSCAMHFAVADQTPITAGLNAPAISNTGGTTVFWGPMISQTSISMNGNANTNFPQIYAGTSIQRSGGSGFTGSFCVNPGPIQSGPGSTAYQWFCNYPVPPAPQVSMADYRYIAQLEDSLHQSSACGGQPCYYSNTGTVNLSINVPPTDCTVDGHPKVLFFEGNAKFSGSTYFCGVVVAEGSVDLSGNGGQTITVTPPSNAWEQYQVATPLNPGGPGDTSAVNEYPGDVGYHVVQQTSISGVSIQGYIFASTGYTATGGTKIVGSVQFGSGVSSSSGGGTIYFEPQIIFTQPAANTVDEPIITPPGGNFSTPVSVTIGETTSGASVYYTVDGTSPDPVQNPNALLYTGPFTLAGPNSTLVQAIGVEKGMTNSAIASAQFTFNGGGSGGGSNSTSLTLTKTVNQSTVGTGTPVTFTLTVTNSGTSTANTVQLIDTLPSGLSFSNIVQGGAACGQQNGTVTCNWPSIAAGSNQIVQIVANTPTPGTFTNTGTATSANANTAQDNAVVTVTSGGSGGSSVLSSIIVNPQSATVNAGGTQQYTAQGYDQYNNPITIPSLSWSITGTTSGNSITSAGLATAGNLSGAYAVTALSGSTTGQASLTIVSQSPVLTTIVVSPANITLNAGAQQQYTAQGFDQYGNVMAGLSFVWQVSSQSGSSTIFSATGLLTAGTVSETDTVTAQSSGITGNTMVTIVAVGTGGSLLPTLTSIDPSSGPVNGPSFTLLAIGMNFFPDSVVQWNGVAQPTTYLNSTQLTAAISGSYLAVAGTAGISVLNPETGGGQSNALPFTISSNVSGFGPGILIQPSANPNPVPGKMTNLSVLGFDPTSPSSDKNLTYTWMAVGPQPGVVTFSDNSTNTAKNCTATFSASGLYVFRVLITKTDVNPSLTVISDNLNVVVLQTPSTLTVTPENATIPAGQPQTFTATVFDQFQRAISNPTVTWSVNQPYCSISNAGVFVAQLPMQAVQITGISGAAKGTASVTVQLVFSTGGNNGNSGAVDISHLKAYPVPWKITNTNSSDGVTFANLAPSTEIKLFTPNGRVIRTLMSHQGEDISWDIKNMNGERVASGVYMYRAENSISGQVVKGKIVIIN